METSSAHAAVATNIAPTEKQIILLALFLIPFGWELIDEQDLRDNVLELAFVPALSNGLSILR